MFGFGGGDLRVLFFLLFMHLWIGVIW